MVVGPLMRNALADALPCLRRLVAWVRAEATVLCTCFPATVTVTTIGLYQGSV